MAFVVYEILVFTMAGGHKQAFWLPWLLRGFLILGGAWATSQAVELAIFSREISKEYARHEFVKFLTSIAPDVIDLGLDAYAPSPPDDADDGEGEKIATFGDPEPDEPADDVAASGPRTRIVRTPETVRSRIRIREDEETRARARRDALVKEMSAIRGQIARERRQAGRLARRLDVYRQRCQSKDERLRAASDACVNPTVAVDPKRVFDMSDEDFAESVRTCMLPHAGRGS